MRARYGSFYKWDLIRHKQEGYLLWFHEEYRMARVPGEMKMRYINLDEFEYAFMEGDVLERDNTLYRIEDIHYSVLGFKQNTAVGVEELCSYNLVQRQT